MIIEITVDWWADGQACVSEAIKLEASLQEILEERGIKSIYAQYDWEYFGDHTSHKELIVL